MPSGCEVARGARIGRISVHPFVPLGVLVAQRWLLGGQAARRGGGSLTRSNSAVQSACQDHDLGRCRVTRREEVAARAGTVISLRRMVAVVAFAICGSVRLAAARARLNAMTASASQAALAVNTSDGRWAQRGVFSGRRGPAR